MMSKANKRVTNGCWVKMSRSVKPGNISPTIKTARYVFLIAGIMYGTTRLKALRVFEETEHVIREKAIHAKYVRLAKEAKERTKDELIALAKEFEVTELTPGWDDSI